MTQLSAQQSTRLRGILLPFVGLLLSFLFCGIMLALFGIDPLKTYLSIFTKAFGSKNGVSQTIATAIPMIIIAVGIDFAKRGGIFNIGAEGQMILGALGAQLAAQMIPQTSAGSAVALVLVGGALFGALWALLPALFKASLGVNEVVVTIMMNQIAAYLIAFLVRGPLKDPKDFNQQSVVIPQNAELPVLIPGTKIHTGIILAIVLIVVIWFVVKRTTYGFRIHVVGSSTRASVYAGISPKATVFTAFLIAGAIAGLAGANQIAGFEHRLTNSVSNGYGFIGLTVAMIAGGNPFLIVIVSILYSALQYGGLIIQISQKVPMELSNIIQGVTVLFVMCTDSFYDLVRIAKTRPKRIQTNAVAKEAK
ncbi:MAG TPA: ABC transporter permease [Clostridia bacterium]|nr:ABC transporter permease [Clostridia bacterium]